MQDTVRDAITAPNDALGGESSEVDGPIDDEPVSDPGTGDGEAVALPEWFVEPEQRNRVGAYTQVSWTEGQSTNTVRRSEGQSTFIHGAQLTASDAQTNDGLTLGSVGGLNNDIDSGFLLPPEVLNAANQVPEFPVIWGRWNDVDEMFTFSTPTDEEGNPVSGELNVFRHSAADLGFDGGAWLSSTAPSLSLAEVSTIRATQTIRFGSGSSFATGPVQILQSDFSAGTLVESESFMDFTVNLDDGFLMDGALEVVVSGDGFDEVWSWSVDHSQFARTSGFVVEGSGDSSFKEPRVFFNNASVTRTDGSFDGDFPDAAIQVVGFIVESGENTIDGNAQLGFAGSSRFFANDENGERASDGAILMILPEN